MLFRSTLSPPTTGTYAGILFFQSRTNTKGAKFHEGGDLDVSGALYFPKANLEFGNSKTGPVATDCALFIAKKITFKKKADMVNTCSAFGNSPLHSVTVAE